METLWRAVRADLPAAELLSTFRTTGRLPVAAAVQVYKNAYWIRQHAALCDMFPATKGLFGEDGFRELVRQYIRSCPSAHPALEWLGYALADFMAASSDTAWRNAAQVARFEQAKMAALVAPPSEVAPRHALQLSHIETTRFVFQPGLGVTLLDDTLREIVKAPAGMHAIVTTRPRYHVVTTCIDATQFDLLGHARLGATVAELIEAARLPVNELALMLGSWFDQGWITRIKYQ